MGSADEVRACMQVAEGLGYIELDAELVAEATRIARVLHKLAR